MASAASEAAIAGASGDARAIARAADDYATAAWLSALPCAVLVVISVLLLGPPLGDLLLSPPETGYTFLADHLPAVRPEPAEQARFLLSLLAPVLATLAIALAPRWLPRVPARIADLARPATEIVLGGLLLACAIAQYRIRYPAEFTLEGTRLTMRYFTPATLVVAAALAAATLLVVRREDLRTRAQGALAETRAKRIGAVAVAIAMTVVWLLHAVHSDGSIAMAAEDVRFHVAFPLDEAFAVLDGRTPLVDFSAQYGSLWPYGTALAMLAFGESLLTFTVAMCTLSALALLAIFGVLRRVSRSSVAALLLFLPFLATSLFQIGGTLVERSSVGSYFGTFPLRYAGPFLLAWLTTRQIERGSDGVRGLWALFAVAGLVLLNNGDFGVAALGATLAALLWSGYGIRRPSPRALAIGVAAGLATAFALVCALTLATAGALPQLDRLVDYARLFARAGYNVLPIAEPLGLHLIVYVTYVAAIVVASVRALQRAPDRLLTGMLAWSGVFGLGSAAYFVGRSHPVALKSTFSAWALALALLTIVVVRLLAAHPRRRPSIAAVAVLFGFGVAVCSLAQTPLPWSQIERLNAPFVASEDVPQPNPLAPSGDPDTRRFITSGIPAGGPVASLLTNGHRVAEAYGVVNVSPYTGIHSIPTDERVGAVVDALRAAGGDTVILPNPLAPSILDALEARGFELVTDDGPRTYVPGRTRATEFPWPDGGNAIKWVDARKREAPTNG